MTRLITRRLCALLVLAASVQLSVAAQKKLNILFVFGDDWGRYASCYAELDGRPTPNDVIKTPNIDCVARDGVLFRNAFVNSPSCTPCRSSMLSGRYFFNCNRGAILQGAVWDDSIPTFPLMLRDAGYHIGKSYKVWSPGMPADAPFGEQRYAYEKAGRAPNSFSEGATERIKRGMTVAQAREEILNQVRANFDSFLAGRKPGQSWHYFFGPTTTHRRWVKGSGKKLWGIEPDSLKGKMPKFLPDVPEVREDVGDYLGECQALDAYVGVLMKRLEETGELENTLVVISGDHGMPGVPSGKCNLADFGTRVALVMRKPGANGSRIVDDFVCLTDLAPTFMEIGGVTPPAGLYGRSLMPILESTDSGQIDRTRTMVVMGRERHVAGARPGNLPYPARALRTPEFLYVRNFAPERWPMGSPKQVTDGETPPEIETNTRAGFADMDGSPTKAWLIAHRNEGWKWHYDFAFAKRPAEELYDVRKDAEQTNNLAADPKYQEIKGRLAARLMKTLTDAKDPRVTGDGRTFDRPPFTSEDDRVPRRSREIQKEVK